MLVLTHFIFSSSAFANGELWKQSIEDSRDFIVVVDDILGESNAFDTDPMQVSTHVNCMVWLQWVLSRYYSYVDKTSDSAFEEVQREYLNQIRYFEEPNNYGNRIHYVDRWIFVANNYLVPNNTCVQSKLKEINLPLDDFFSGKNWTSDFFEPDARNIIFPYSTNSEFLECVSNNVLSNGFYLVFPVANDAYKSRWEIQGDIGLVHSMILEVGEEKNLLWHASIDMGKVLSEKPVDFVDRISHLIDGYVIVNIHR